MTIRTQFSAALALLVLVGCGDDGRPPPLVDGGPLPSDGGPLPSDGGPRTDAPIPPSDGGGSVCDGVDCSSLDDQCNAGTCDPSDGSCAAVPLAAGTVCDDAMACTSGDVCAAGVCAGVAVDCAGLTDMCNVGACEPSSGACVAMPMADGTGCDDGSLCTTGDACAAGACVGTGTDCSGMSDMCNTGTCDPTTGTCGRTLVADGTTCDDGVACTTADICTSGTCGGTLTTPAGDSCAGAIPITPTLGTQMLTGTNDCATDDVRTCAGTAGLDVIYTFTLTAPAQVTAVTANVGGAFDDTVLAILGTCATGAAQFACNDDFSGLYSRVDRVLPAGTYFLVLDGYSDLDVGSYRIDFTVASAPTPETCASAIAVPTPPRGGVVRVSGSTAGATNDFTSTCGASAASGDHVYSLTVTSRSRFRIETLDPASGIYDTVLHVRGSPCATGAGTTIVCDDDGGTGTRSRIDRVFDPGTYYIVVDGYNTTATGEYILEVESLLGHAVLLGHDFFEREPNADRALGNAVFVNNHRSPELALRIVDYTQFADASFGGEIELTRAAIAARATALGRSTTYTNLTDYTLLDLSNADVLLVYEQESSFSAMMATVGAAWSARLDDFIRDGGVIVVLDYSGESFEILDGSGLMTIPSARNATFMPVDVTTPSDPIAAGVTSGYSALNGSNAYPGSSGGTVVLSEAGDPLCLHLAR